MPCRDYYDDHPEAYFRDVTEPALKKRIAFAESALCATLDALDRYVHRADGGKGDPDAHLRLIDYEAAGTSFAELKKWKEEHEELDKKHRAAELEKAKATGLAKLSPLEIKALGIKKGS